MAVDPRAKKHARTVEVDERWIGDWLQLGLAEMATFLAVYAAFETYYQQREEELQRGQ